MVSKTILDGMKDRYINHPKARLEKLKEIVDNRYHNEKDFNNALNGIIIACNNYNQQSFDMFIRPFAGLLSDDITLENLQEQFATILSLLKDVCSSAKETGTLENNLYQATINEINEFASMLSKLSIQEPMEVEEKIEKSEDNLPQTTNDKYQLLYQYCQYLEKLIRVYNDLQNNIDVNNKNYY